MLRSKPRAVRKLAAPARWAFVETQIREGWSPQQIALRLRHERPDDRTRCVSHETICQAIYLIPRGDLRRELMGCLRQGHATRKPRTRGKDRRSQIPDMQSIHIRPPEVATRLVPGHWEGDQIKGAGNRSAVGVLVDRQHSPWQRGTCENTNGLLRQYMPKDCNLTRYSQQDLDGIALSLNTRPRARHAGRTPLDCYEDLITLDQMQTTNLQ